MAPISPLVHHCNDSNPCIDAVFYQQSHSLQIYCQHTNSCNNVTLIASSSSLCSIHCHVPLSCNGIISPTHCECDGHCSSNIHRHLLSDHILSASNDYVYFIIIGGLVLFCGILLFIMYCKWRRERRMNHGRHRERSIDPLDLSCLDEKKSLSADENAKIYHQTHIISDDSINNYNVGMFAHVHSLCT